MNVRTEQQLLSILKAAPVGIGTVINRVIQEASSRLCSMTGYSAPELVGQSIRVLYESEEEYERAGREKYKSLHEHGWGATETRWMRKDGTVMDVLVSSATIEPGHCEQGVTFIALDISEWKKAELALQVQNARWRDLFYGAPEGIVLLDNDLRVVFLNSEFTRIFGYTEAELIGVETPSVLTPEDKRSETEQAVAQLRRGEVVRIEQTVRMTKDGRRVPVSVLSKPIRLDEDHIGVYGIYRDISELDRAQRIVQQSLHEKELLLQEIHHRVKNNLSIVSGLLALQAAEHPNPGLSEQLEHARARVKSMAMIHERLYRSGNLAQISFDEYLQDLARDAAQAYLTDERVRFDLRLHKVSLTLDTAIPCGLLVNEMIVNSLRHAFPGGRRGTITVELGLRDGAVRLRVADDGVGMPDPGLLETIPSMGTELIRELASQINAQLCRHFDGGGTAYELTIPTTSPAGDAPPTITGV